MRRNFSSDTVQLASRVPKALHQQVRLAAIESGQTLAEWLTDAFEAHLAKCRGTKPGAPPRRESA